MNRPDPKPWRECSAREAIALAACVRLVAGEGGSSSETWRDCRTRPPFKREGASESHQGHREMGHEDHKDHKGLFPLCSWWPTSPCPSWHRDDGHSGTVGSQRDVPAGRNDQLALKTYAAPASAELLSAWLPPTPCEEPSSLCAATTIVRPSRLSATDPPNSSYASALAAFT
jgi:hypothetical protein